MRIFFFSSKQGNKTKENVLINFLLKKQFDKNKKKNQRKLCLKEKF